MNYEANDLLAMVDEWKFRVHDKLKNMSPKQRQDFWRQAGDKARAMGLKVVTKLPKKKPAAKPLAGRRRSKA